MAMAGLHADARRVWRTRLGAGLARQTSSRCAEEFLHRHASWHVGTAGAVRRPLDCAEEIPNLSLLAFPGVSVADAGLAGAVSGVVAANERYRRVRSGQVTKLLWHAQGLRILEERSRVALPVVKTRPHHARLANGGPAVRAIGDDLLLARQRRGTCRGLAARGRAAHRCRRT